MLTKVHERNWKSTFSKIEAFKEDDDDDEPCDCWPLIQRFKHTIFDEKKNQSRNTKRFDEKKQSRAFKCDLCFKLFLPLRFYVKSFFEIPKVPKTAILTFLEALNIYFEDFLHFWRAEFCQTQISELLKLQK